MKSASCVLTETVVMPGIPDISVNYDSIMTILLRPVFSGNAKRQMINLFFEVEFGNDDIF